MTSILLTGESDFIGSRLSSKLAPDFHVRQVFRKEPVGDVTSDYVLCDFSGNCDSQSLLSGIDVVIHCIERAHITNDTASKPLDEFRKVNVDVTLSLALQAENSGVKRFIFLGSMV